MRGKLALSLSFSKILSWVFAVTSVWHGIGATPCVICLLESGYANYVLVLVYLNEAMGPAVVMSLQMWLILHGMAE